MKERPIIFSGPMARAIREGRKTQTRRVVKPQPPEWCTRFGYTTFTPAGSISGRGFYGNSGPAEKFFKSSYGVPADRLWVRETFSVFCVTDYSRGDVLPSTVQVGIGYRADHKTGNLADGDGGYNFYPVEGEASIAQAERIMDRNYDVWVPSIYMPRWASRITLEITDVRVQRLQEISEEDALAEGCVTGLSDDSELGPGIFTAKLDYATLWDSINSKRGFPWEMNPWVWAITFRRIIA